MRQSFGWPMTVAPSLVTADQDFGELVFRLGRWHSGLVPLRLAGLPLSAKADLVAEAFQRHAAELPGAFSVFIPEMIRIRPAPKI